jgi:hypothetical protein
MIAGNSIAAGISSVGTLWRNMGTHKMAGEIISKKTRYEFREFFVGWVLREIEMEFDAADIPCHPPEGLNSLWSSAQFG